MLSPAPSIQYSTAGDGYRLRARVWKIDKPVGIVVCLHGIISHGGWYLKTGAHLARMGFEVHLLDRRGSGLNERDRGDVDRVGTWLADVEDYLECLDHAPRILLGISWGGTLATAVARHRPELLAGVGLLCPGLFSRKAATFPQRIALRALGALGLARKQVGIPLQDPALFTNCPRAKAYIGADPLALRKMTVAFALANLDLTRFATEKPEAIDVPALLVLAGKDPIADNRLLRQFFSRVGHPEKTVFEYPGCSHTLEFEPNPAKYLEDLSQWCLDIVGKYSPFSGTPPVGNSGQNGIEIRKPIATRTQSVVRAPALRNVLPKNFAIRRWYSVDAVVTAPL